MSSRAVANNDAGIGERMCGVYDALEQGYALYSEQRFVAAHALAAAACENGDGQIHSST